MKAVILGSTLSAIREALRLRAAGWSVLLCAQSTYLAEDVTATWHGYGVCHQAWLGDRLAAAGLCVEPPFLPGRIKKEALRVLLDADVQVRFMTRAAGLLREEGRICGVVLARKGGLDREGCDLLLDATLYHVASARLTQRAVLVPASREVRFSLEYRGITLAQDVLPLSDHEVLERGPVAQDHAYLTVTHAFSQDTSLQGARAALLSCALHAAKRLARDERFLHLEMTNALPDQVFMESPETEQAVEITDGLSFDASWAAYPVCPAQVLVCGAGTAGIRAALAAAQAGDVLLAELFPYPGGTRTMGGIQWLYYGNRSPLFQKMFAEIERYAGALTHGRTYSHFGSAEAFLYLEKLRESGVAYRPDTLICGARLSGRRISEVLCVSTGEIFVVHPDKVLDATGDGDVAALCGVPMETGDSLTGMVQNYSQTHRVSGTRFDSPMADQDTLRTDLPEEWQRAVIQNTLGGAEYDCMEMLTPRESSRILGQYRITLEDAARGHVEPDALIDAYSSYDPHCRCLSLPGRLGLMPERAKPRYVSIPYRALRTHEAGNLLVLGKAISATQDAFNYCRMCADVMALGHAAGRIAALSDDLSAPALTEVQQEMLAGGALVRRPSSEPYDENTAERVIAPLLCGEEGALAEVVLCAWPQTQKLLLGAMESGVLPNSKRVAHALLFTGDTRLAPDVLEDFVQRDEALAGQYGELREADGLIHGGYRNAPNDVWLVNQAMVLLAHVQYRPAIPALCAAMERTGLGAFYHPQTATYGNLRPDCMTNSTYDRMLCMAEVGLLMPDGALAGPLMRLSYLAQDIEPQDQNVYMAYLALRLAHAALLCGSGDAQTVIETYGRHPHGVLRTYAQRILEAGQGEKMV